MARSDRQTVALIKDGAVLMAGLMAVGRLVGFELRLELRLELVSFGDKRFHRPGQFPARVGRKPANHVAIDIRCIGPTLAWMILHPLAPATC